MSKLMTRYEITFNIKKGNYEFAWINTFSDLKLIDLKNNQLEFDWLNDLIEAKFFNTDTELSIISNDSEEKFSVVEFNGKDKEYVEEKQIIYKDKSPFKNENDRLVIRNYIDYDEDGQAYIYYSKLCDVEGEMNYEQKE